MSEYITGRVPLNTAGSQKCIKSDKSKKNLKKEPVFAKEDDGSILVEEAAAAYGIRCGAALEGFAVEKLDGVNKSVKWPKGKKTCRLSELKEANSLTNEHILVFKTPCVYCTRTVTVDTKKYGLPQTRLRTYMFVWKPRNENIADDLGDYFSAIAKHLESPCRFSLEAFMQPDSHENIRKYREALRGPQGRNSRRSAFQEFDFWTSASANLPHNKNTRRILGLKDRDRWFTNWGPHGQKQLPLNAFVEYFDCNGQRTCLPPLSIPLLKFVLIHPLYFRTS